jgi:hypothetical protein
MWDETDVVELIEFKPEKVSAEGMAQICRALLAMADTPEEVKKYRAQVGWSKKTPSISLVTRLRSPQRPGRQQQQLRRPKCQTEKPMDVQLIRVHRLIPLYPWPPTSH